MKYRIAVLPGDGVGPEVMAQALRILRTVGNDYGHEFNTTFGLVGGTAYDEYETHLPDDTLALCENSDAVLFGSVGGPVIQQNQKKWKNCEANSILALRKHFKFNANYRPVRLLPELEALCPLKKDIIGNGIDILFIRELLGDAYFGRKDTTTDSGQRVAWDESVYTEEQVRSVARAAFAAAKSRRRKVTSVDKANVLEASRLWRAVVREVAQEFPAVELEEILVDNFAMQLIKRPTDFDVVVTTNMFGDILTDEAAALAGSLGLLSSASTNTDGFGLYEPPGGSAPDIAGKGVANPIGQIMSTALMLRFSFGLEREANAIELAVEDTLRAGYRTADIYRGEGTLVDTKQMTDQILARMPVRKPVCA
jgi:3-isopropylmalate dehydrogenase